MRRADKSSFRDDRHESSSLITEPQTEGIGMDSGKSPEVKWRGTTIEGLDEGCDSIPASTRFPHRT